MLFQDRISHSEPMTVQRGIRRVRRSRHCVGLPCPFWNSRDAHRRVSFALRELHFGSRLPSCQSASLGTSTSAVIESAQHLVKTPEVKPVLLSVNPQPFRPESIILLVAVALESVDQRRWPSAQGS